MGTTKTQLFTKQQNRLAALGHALGHPARIAIIEYLTSVNKCINGDLVNELGLAQSTISQHLSVLKDVGIIQGEISGVTVCYCLNPAVWNELLSLFESLSHHIIPNSKNDCC